MKRQPSAESRILHVLQASYPEWTPAPVLARISLQYSARLFSLRKRGWQIANRVEVVNGVKHGFFRLAQPMSWPNPRRKSRAPLSSNLASQSSSAPAPAAEPAEKPGELFPGYSPETRHRDDG